MVLRDGLHGVRIKTHAGMISLSHLLFVYLIESQGVMET